MPYKIYIYGFGVISILISLITWYMDLTGMVEPCIYCRTQRTIIGVLGLMMFFPVIPILTPYVSTVIGFFGATVATEQMFMIIMKYKINLHLILSTDALFIIIAQVMFFYYLSFLRASGSKNKIPHR